MIAHISCDGQNRTESVEQHTGNAQKRAQDKGKRCHMEKIMSLNALLHDIGKEKIAFSNYLNADEGERKKLKGTVVHASTGAKYIYDRFHNSNDGYRSILAELISIAIASHHGIFDCVDFDRKDNFTRKMTEVEDYKEACENAEREFLKKSQVDSLFECAYMEFSKILKKLIDLSNAGTTSEEKCYSLFFYFSCLERLMLSMLIDSDWESTSAFMNQREEESNDTQQIKDIFAEAKKHFEDYMCNLSENFLQKERTQNEMEIFKARSELQKECIDFANHSAGIYRLPLPTGGGKTLSGLAYALSYCEKHKETERVIYIAPYISVTEQNADVIREAIGNKDWLLEQHSAVVQDEDETTSENYQSDRMKQLDINWEEPFICTTFVQFMNTLFSDKKQDIRRMHRLVNSVIIIDEVQSMPMKCVDSFNCMMNFLNAVCNTDIILCTATQPKFDEAEYPIQYSEPAMMIHNTESRFVQFERVKIHFYEKKYTFDDLKNEITERIQNYHSILIVLNTRTAVKKLYTLLKEENVQVEYLTTYLCAEHRSDKIKSIKEKLEKLHSGEGKPLVVISTNLIEAGVDISFECVYRSMTGFDSIAQTAGRCNRNGEKEYGDVYVIELKEEKTGNMSELMAADQATRATLIDYDGNESILQPKWMDRYFHNLFRDGKQRDVMRFYDKGKDVNIMQLLSVGFSLRRKDGTRYPNKLNHAYKTAGQMYKIIDNNSIGVIVPYKKGKEIIHNLQQETEPEKIRKCIRQAQRYTINIEKRQLKNCEQGIMRVSEKCPNIYCLLPEYYHDEYGFSNEMPTLMF